MTGRRSRREHDATEMIPGGRNGRRSVASRRRAPRGTAVLEAAREPDATELIGAALDRSTRPGAAFPLAGPQPEQSRQSLAGMVQQDPRFAAIGTALELHAPGRPQPAQEPARQALEAADAARQPRFTPSRGLPAPPAAPAPPAPQRSGYSTPGPVHITGELPLFAEALQARAGEAEPGHDALPSLLWCAGCGRDFTDDATAEYDRMLQFLQFRAAEAGWRRDARGLMHCPQCQQSRWMATWCPPVLAGGGREAWLRRSVEGPLPQRRRDFMPVPEIAFSAPVEEAATVTYEDDGPRVRVDWKAVIARPRRPEGSQGGRHRRQSGRNVPVRPPLSHMDLPRIGTSMEGRWSQ